MNTVKTVGLAVIVGLGGMLADTADARPFGGRHPIDPVKRAEKEMEYQRAAMRPPHPVVPGRHHMAPPPVHPPHVSVWAHQGRRPIHVAITRQVWVPGRYEQVVEYRTVSNPWGGGCRTEPVVVTRWVPGYYTTVPVYGQGLACR